MGAHMQLRDPTHTFSAQIAVMQAKKQASHSRHLALHGRDLLNLARDLTYSEISNIFSILILIRMAGHTLNLLKGKHVRH